MKILLGLTKTWTTIEHRTLKQVDLHDFMMEHFPREHGWHDDQESLAFLQKALPGEYMQTVLQQMKKESKIEISREEPELVSKKFWAHKCE